MEHTKKAKIGKKTETIKIRLSEVEKDMFEFMADYNSLNVSAYIMQLVRKDFNQCQLKDTEK